MEKYVQPEMDIMIFDYDVSTNDVIITSKGGNTDIGGDWDDFYGKY